MSHKSIYILSLLFLFLYWPSSGKAQNAVEDIQKINKAYLTNTTFSMDVVVNVYAKANSKRPDEVQMGFAKRKKEYLHTQIGDVETIKSVSTILSIDHKNKRIVIAEPENSFNVLPDGMASKLELLLSYCEKVLYVDISKNTGKYVLVMPSYTYKQFEFEFNKQTYLLEKLIMIVNEKLIENYNPESSDDKLKIVIEYNNINLNPVFSNNEFTTWKYITNDGNVFKLTKEYQNYTIINQLPIK
ncbi:MAG: hypothetical protein A2W99_13365 [Bacteroidetes bacterium GWF2_33_16]|nr:MAG: hypothetical protein A2X00_00910 [Bacteroidetes bacterium GWE2_32_14]OFY06667.1 MAG: hypothetical protein A2W99_13365 [Bacteroidetes bacterium GWF2_33_16]